MPVLVWANLDGLPIPWEQFPPDVAERWQLLKYAVICVMDYGDEAYQEYQFMMCDKDWNVGASDFSYTLEGAKAALAKEIRTDGIDWIPVS